MDIEFQADLDEYVEEAESRVKRARARLEVEMTANAEKGSDKPQAIIPLLTVSKDLSQLRELEDARDAELHTQAMAIEKQRKAEADEKKRKLAQEPKSLPLEKLALQALRKKAVQTMTDLCLRLAATLATLTEERRKIVEWPWRRKSRISSSNPGLRCGPQIPSGACRHRWTTSSHCSLGSGCPRRPTFGPGPR